MTCMKHEIVQQIIDTEVQDPNYLKVQNSKETKKYNINEDLGILQLMIGITVKLCMMLQLVKCGLDYRLGISTNLSVA